jgi:hypothetical protein
MLNFEFWSPTCFVFGKDTERETGIMLSVSTAARCSFIMVAVQ